MEIILRSIITFIVLLITINILGKKQIQHLTMYDYVIGITIGSIAADSIISTDLPIINGIISLILFGIIGYVISYITYKSHGIEEYIDGEPVILFYKNKFITENLEKTKLSVAQVLEQCRLKGCFDLNYLDCAILEPSGGISILLKQENIKKNKKQRLCYALIIDGQVDYSELKRLGKKEKWLKDILKSKKTKIKNILLLSVDEQGDTRIFEK